MARYRGVIAVDSAVLGRLEAKIAGIMVLDRDVDVVWITPKATDLQVALALAPAAAVKAARVIPLMRRRSHGRAPGQIRTSPRRQHPRGVGTRRRWPDLTNVSLHQDGPRRGRSRRGRTEVSAAGIDCAVGADETTLLWQKLAFLAPLALATTAADAPPGVIRHDAVYTRAQAEVLAVARAQGALIDLAALEAQRAAAPDTMRSSMQHDVEQGRIPELDAIAGPVRRAGREHGLATPAVENLFGQVRARAASATS